MPFYLDENYNSFDRVEKWDAESQNIIKKRIANELGDTLSFNFLTEREGEILELLVDALILQEKNEEYIHPIESRETGLATPAFNRVKISELIDRDLEKNVRGVRIGANPWPREFYRTGLADFAREAQAAHGKPIEDFSNRQIEKFISEIFAGNYTDFLRRFLRKVLSDATTIYFSHPESWNKIGFPGPAFPAGYPFLDCGEKEDWEPEYIRQ